MTHTPASWTVIVPVRPPAQGKSRLHVPGVDHASLARAIALDTIEAAARVADVVVVSADPSLETTRTRLVLEDEPGGIAAAIRLGLDEAPGPRRAVLLGDLPGLVPGDLAHALELAEQVRLGAVPDEERQGTTLVTAREGDLPTAFGHDSWRRHQSAGFLELPLPGGSSLRRDVDTADHLGPRLGPRTAALLRR